MVILKRVFTEVSIEEINFEDRSFLFSYPERTPFIIESIKEIGLIEPPLLQKNQAGYSIVSGEGRIKALKELGYKSFPAQILDENLPKATLILLSLESNLGRGLNLVEKALFLEKAEPFYSKEKLIQLLPKLGFTPHIKWYYFLKSILCLEEPFRDLLIKGALNPKVVETLAGLSEEERKEFLFLFEKIEPTFSEQREFLETLLDHKKKTNLFSLLTEEMKKIMEIEDLNLRKKSFKELILKLKYPTYYSKKDQIDKIKHTLSKHYIKLDFSPFLEKKEVSIEIKCQTLEDLREKLNLLSEYGERIFRVFE